MKKKIVSVLMVISIMSVFSACCISHEWKDATCTEAKTCAKCGETEGDALGHAWQEATCSTPKTCTNCGKTEGEVLGHTLTEANYQQGPTCQVCGEEVGEPLEANAEKEGIVCNAELNIPYDYIARCLNAEENATAQVVFSDYRIFSGDETHEALEGYEWRSVTATLTFYADGNAGKYGFRVGHDFGEYYLEDNQYDNETGMFTVNYYGKDYSDCLVDLEKTATDWTAEGTRIITEVFYVRVPIGFDGMYVFYYNDSFDEEDMIHNSVFFRLNKEYVVTNETDTELDSIVLSEEDIEKESVVQNSGSDTNETTVTNNTEPVTSNEQSTGTGNSSNATSSSGGVVFEIVIDQTCQHEIETISQKISESYTYPVVTSYGYKCGACDSVVDESYIFCPVCNAEGTVEPYDVIEDVTVPAQYSCAEVCSKCNAVLRTWVEDGEE